MSRWFRFYDDAVNDPKILRLSDNLFRIWIGLLCLASKNDGALPPIEDVCVVLRLKPSQVESAMQKLVIAGLIDHDGTKLAPHNWNGRQYKSDVSTDRVKRFRKRHETVSVTPPDTDTDTDTEQRSKKEGAIALSVQAATWFETFWSQWPNKVGKPAALKAFNSAMKRADSLEAILAGVDNYIRDKPPDRQWLNPATFLNQNRWEDKPAQVQNGKTSNVLQAADNLVSILDSFGRGAAETDAIRGPASTPNVRLISQG